VIYELRCVVFLVSLIAAAPLLRAQTYGEITGTITDASGAVVAAAGVAVSNTANNQTRRVTSNESGNFTVPFLVPGLYDIRVEKEGFKTDTRRASQSDFAAGSVAHRVTPLVVRRRVFQNLACGACLIYDSPFTDLVYDGIGSAVAAEGRKLATATRLSYI
jgi:hypothetical protein